MKCFAPRGGCAPEPGAKCTEIRYGIPRQNPPQLVFLVPRKSPALRWKNAPLPGDGCTPKRGEEEPLRHVDNHRPIPAAGCCGKERVWGGWLGVAAKYAGEDGEKVQKVEFSTVHHGKLKFVENSKKKSLVNQHFWSNFLQSRKSRKILRQKTRDFLQCFLH